MLGEAGLMTFAKAFIISAIVVIAVIPLLRPIAHRLDVVARPKNDRWHRGIVPLMGGLGIWLGALIGGLTSAAIEPQVLVIAGAGTLLMAIGLWDDIAGLRPGVKLIAQIAVSCGLVAAGITVHWTPSPAINAMITIGWVVGTTNAFNLLDNMDGLCAGIAAITAVALCWTLGPQDLGIFAFSAAIAGAAAGFLVYNFNPASVFMGDSGSLFLGVSLACLALAGRPSAARDAASAFLVPVALMLIPIFDTTLVTAFRKLSSRAVSVGGRDHTSHRLVAMGFSERQAVLLLWGLAASAGAAAIGLGHRSQEADVVLALLLVGLVLLAVRLSRVNVYDGEDFRVLRDKSFTPLLVEFMYKRRLLEILLDVLLISIAYYESWLLRFGKVEFLYYYNSFAGSLPIVIAFQSLSLMVAGVYGGTWRHVGLADLPTYARGVLLAVASSLVAILFSTRFEGFSRGVFVIDLMALLLLLIGSRVSFRVLGELAGRSSDANAPRAAIYGAGEGGAAAVRELRSNRDLSFKLVGFLDDDNARHGSRILRLPVLGGMNDLERLIAELNLGAIIVSTDTLAPERMDALQRLCMASGTQLLQLKFRLTDLLEREPRPR